MSTTQHHLRAHCPCPQGRGPRSERAALSFSRGLFQLFLTHSDGLHLLGDGAPAAHLPARDVHEDERAFLLVPDGRLPDPVALTGNALDLNGWHACGENQSCLRTRMKPTPGSECWKRVCVCGRSEPGQACPAWRGATRTEQSPHSNGDCLRYLRRSPAPC